MKKVHYLLFAVFLLIVSCDTKKKNPVEGTWELISADWFFNDTVKLPNSEYDREIKIFGEKYFLFIRQDTTNNDLFFSGGGTYSFKENKITETLEFASWVKDIGETTNYECKFEGDIWILTGPVSIEGEKEYSWHLCEKWKRIK